MPYFLLLLMSTILSAQTISAGYDVTFSVFGKIGEAVVRYERFDERYVITAEGRLTGEAAAIGANRGELHESFGIVKEGLLVPELYKVTRSSDHYYNQSFFVFYPQERRAEEHRMNEKYGTKNHFDAKTFRIVSSPYTTKSIKLKPLDYYAQNDLLSLFFNVQPLIATLKEGETRLVHAMGGSNKKGEVLLGNPGGAKRADLIKSMSAATGHLATVLINQDIFKSDKGELWIRMDGDLLVEEALLKDVLLFGDIRGYRTWSKKE